MTKTEYSIDLETAIDHPIKNYLNLILTNELSLNDDLPTSDKTDLLVIEEYYLKIYEQTISLLSGDDYNQAILYKDLIQPMISMILRRMTLLEKTKQYRLTR